jgi:hypothetical protein
MEAQSVRFEASSSSSPREARATHTLASLADLDVEALGRVYDGGTVPASLQALDGHPRGRMLAVRTLDAGVAARGLRSFSGASAFPWGGKSFSADRASSGKGVNRVHLLGRHQLFPFETRFAPSRIDGRPCILLDYDLPDNPSLIRKIHDEVREVSPGLFLGPAMWKTAAEPAFVLWFALDTRDQATPIGAR